uniref:Uncharacterized protein n=1 Tax=Triticum urartu TaxID=4572 RepID=A0A8R7UDA3_TRIUA
MVARSMRTCWISPDLVGWRAGGGSGRKAARAWSTRHGVGGREEGDGSGEVRRWSRCCSSPAIGCAEASTSLSGSSEWAKFRRRLRPFPLLNRCRN